MTLHPMLAAAQVRAEAERIAQEKAEAERITKEKAEAERITKEKAEADRIAQEEAKADLIAQEKVEADRIAQEKAEAERIAKEKAEADRIAQEEAEADLIAQEKVEASRIAQEKAEAERIAQEKAEADRIAKEKAEADRIAQEKAEAEHIAQEKAEADRIAQEKAEAKRIAKKKTKAPKEATAGRRPKISPWVWGLGGIILLAAVIWGSDQISDQAALSVANVSATHTPLTSSTNAPPTATMPPTATPLPTIIINPIDQAVLAYIPAGSFEMGSLDGNPIEQPVHTVSIDAFWIYQTEVTNTLYAQCVAAGACDPPTCDTYEVDEYGNHPVVCVNWFEAQDYCGWAGSRLPTEAEWENAARGGLAGSTYPWGEAMPTCSQGTDNGAQFWDCDGDTATVGNFGANGYQLYDMTGNVSEWVADWFTVDYYSQSPATNPTGVESAVNRVVRGGSWVSSEGSLRTAVRDYLSPDSKYTNTGFRCAASSQPGSINTQTTTLSIGSTMINPGDQAGLVYVPEGEFEMGNNDGANNEQPVHTVYLDAFWFYQTEVTNTSYAQCVEAGICDPPGCDYYGNDKYNNHPVVCVDWFKAQDYCQWAGGRLSTEAEWEKAARGGLAGKTYPWGDEPPICTQGAANGARFSDCSEKTVAVGSFGANGYGLYDMAGNAWEWVNDWYSVSYYGNSSDVNPIGPESGDWRVLRGGSWSDGLNGIRTASRLSSFPDFTFDVVGFRCAVSPQP